MVKASSHAYPHNYPLPRGPVLHKRHAIPRFHRQSRCKVKLEIWPLHSRRGESSASQVFWSNLPKDDISAFSIRSWWNQIVRVDKKRCFSDPFVVVCMSTNMSSFYWAPNGHLIQFAARFGGWSLCPPVKPVRGSRGVRSFFSTTKTGDVPTGKVFKGQIYRCCLFDSPLKSCWKRAPLQQCFFSSLVKPTWSEIAL